MNHWERKHISVNKEAFELWRDSRIGELLEWVAEYDSFEDWPWPLIYPQIDEAFPGTKFILTRRKTPDIWFESLCQHAERTGPTEFRQRIYGYAMPHAHKEHHIQLYVDHLAAVREYFKDRPADLLEVCWEEGDGWQTLADFLGFEAPDISFPHANKSPSRVAKEQRVEEV